MDDEAQERKRARRVQLLEKNFKLNVDKALQDLMGTKTGRDFISWLFEITKVDQQTFNGHALATAFHCGERNIGLQLKARVVELAPDGFLAMLKERLDERSSTQPNIDRPGNYDGADDSGDND